MSAKWRLGEGYQEYLRSGKNAERQRKWRAKNIERSRGYAKAYKERWPERIKETRSLYANKHNSTHIERWKARSAVITAVRGGNLYRPDVCDICLAACIPDGHHEDYSKRLDVVWACKPCHRILHGWAA